MNEINITSGLLYFNAANHVRALHAAPSAFLERPIFQSLLPQKRTALKPPRGGAAFATRPARDLE
jgi:hypothetical protein